MERMTTSPAEPPEPPLSPLRGRIVGALIFVAIVGVAGAALGIRSLRAAGGATISVSPILQSQLWYKPAPITITINASSFAGAGLTPVAGYQYGLAWDPAVLKWLSGPLVGPGTPTPVPILPCTNAPVMITWGTATATPIGFVPTFTPTPTNTALAGTPTNTFTPTFTPTQTPTPGGYVLVGCSSFTGAATLGSGVLGTFTFQPSALGPAPSAFTLRDVLLVDANATPIAATVNSGSVNFSVCADINGDLVVNGLDLNILAQHFTATAGSPNYLLAADLNKDGAINGLDLNIMAGQFTLAC